MKYDLTDIHFSYSLSVVVFYMMVNSCYACNIDVCMNTLLFHFPSVKLTTWQEMWSQALSRR